MHHKFTLWSILFRALPTLGLRNASPEPQNLNVDVAIIGGGAAGTFAAVRLREDFNKSVVLIEPRDHLGGSVSTYLVPETKTTLEFGVQTYLPYGPAVDFFARFGISPATWTSQRLTPVFVDVETGKKLKDFVPPSLDATNAAFQRWLTIVTKYQDMFEPGYWAFPRPADIPSDLLLPFKDFAKLHQVEAAVPRIMTISGVGTGGFDDLLTFDVVQAFGYTLTKTMLDASFFIPNGSNSLVYQRARDLLGKDVLLSSTVQDVERGWTSSKLRVTQGHTEFNITAKRIFFTAPPSLSALAPYHLDATEKAVFSQLRQINEYIAVVKVPCLPENTTITFTPSSASPANYLMLKEWPYNFRLDSTGPSGLGLFRILFSANFTLSEAEFKDYVRKDIAKLYPAGSVATACTVDFKAVSDHSRPQWHLKAEQLKAGFVQDLYALQNYKGIWYSGYTWAAPYSSTIWAYTDLVIPLLLKDLRHNPTKRGHGCANTINPVPEFGPCN